MATTLSPAERELAGDPGLAAARPRRTARPPGDADDSECPAAYRAQLLQPLDDRAMSGSAFEVPVRLRTGDGFDQKVDHFVQHHRSKELDVSLLLISLVGFLPADDHRVVTTVDAITETLTENGLVLRYRTDGMSTGGLDGAEGTFLVCTFWLVQALAQHGDDERAGAVFERALGVSNDVGLRMVSNFPQACAGWLSR
jgi:hypothetical protein